MKDNLLVKAKMVAVLVGGLVLAAVFLGCHRYGGGLDPNFGDSVRTTLADQTLNLDAGDPNEPIDGFDAVAAGYAADKYKESFNPTEESGSQPVTLLVGSK